jgi:hypothetical protein
MAKMFSHSSFVCADGEIALDTVHPHFSVLIRLRFFVNFVRLPGHVSSTSLTALFLPSSSHSNANTSTSIYLSQSFSLAFVFFH